jgi:hypothetical protein
VIVIYENNRYKVQVTGFASREIALDFISEVRK